MISGFILIKKQNNNKQNTTHTKNKLIPTKKVEKQTIF